MRRTRTTSAIAALVAVFSMLLANLAFADTINLSTATASTTAGASGSFVVFLVADDDSTDLIDGCNAAPTNQTDVAIKFTSSNTGVVASPANATLEGCDNPATAAVENGKTVNYTVAAAAPAGATATITADVLNSEQGIRVEFGSNNNVSGSFTSAEALAVTVAGAGEDEVDPCEGRTAPAAPAVTTAGTPATSGWFNTGSAAGDEAFSVTPSSNAEYSLDGGATWTTYSSAVTLADGEHSVVARNVLPENTDCDAIDGDSSPATAILIDRTNPSATPASVTNTNWRNSDLSETFTFSDGGSGLVPDQGLNADDEATVTASDESADADTPTSESVTIFDVAGNSVTRSVSALIDLTDPTISGAAAPAVDGTNGWYKTAPTVTFTCGDALSGVASCLADGETSDSKTLGESATAQSVGGTATDNAGNENTATVSGLKVDLSNPTNIAFVGGPAAGSNHYFGSVPAAPTCTADDAISGLSSCSVSGHSTAVGTHTLTATATDNAGRTATATRSYSVLAWTLRGFFSPVDMNGALNISKAGSTVPLKFEVFAGPTELTTTDVVSTFRAVQVTCGTLDVLGTDEIEAYTSGQTVLRYDTTGGQFIQNWQTQKAKAGACYRVTMTTDDGSSITALFKLK